MPKLTFLEAKHQYLLDDSLITSVSGILQPIHEKIYGKINATTLKKAAERGTKIHRAIEFMSKSDFLNLVTKKLRMPCLQNIIKYGKSGQPPKPFLRPTKRKTRDACIEAMKAKIESETQKI